MLSLGHVFQKDGTQFKTEIFPFHYASSPTNRVAKKGRAGCDSERQSLCISFPITYLLSDNYPEVINRLIRHLGD